MANRNEQAKKESKVKEEFDEVCSIRQVSNTYATPFKYKTVFLTAAIILALGSIGTSLYILTIDQQRQQQSIDETNQLSTQLQQLAQKQEQLETTITEKINTFEQTHTSVATQFAHLREQVHTALSQKLEQNQNWELLKARYYLELAQINAHWSRSSGSTVTMLQQADKLVQQLDNPQIYTIRQAIAKDIALLNAMPKVDVAGILSQLDAAQNSINDLNIPEILNEKSLKQEEPSQESEKVIPVWRMHMQDSINLLSKIVVIHHNNEQVKPLISPAFEALVKENIHLNLQEAQWAVLNRNPQVYQLVLNQAIANIKRNFNEGTQNAKALIKKLTELQQIQLIQKRPEIGAALPLLNQLINAQHASPKPGVEEQGVNSQ